MKATHIITGIAGTLFLLYIVAFKVYRMHKHPTGKSIIRELKLAIAERLIFAAFELMPEGKQKIMLAKFIVGYVDQEWNTVTNMYGITSDEIIKGGLKNKNKDFNAADNHGRQNENECLEKCFGV